MKVILRQDIDTLGDKNDVKNVAAGYARNYLIPRGLAVSADAANLKDLERRQLFDKRRELKLEKELAKKADKIKGTKLEIKAHTGVEGKLYGSISAKEIAALLSERFKFECDKKRIKLAEPIKRTGEYSVNVRLGENLNVEVTVSVVSDQPIEEKPAEEAPAAEAPAEEAAPAEAAE